MQIYRNRSDVPSKYTIQDLFAHSGPIKPTSSGNLLLYPVPIFYPSTAMIDLLVTLAAKCRVNPTGLTLQLLDPDTGQPLTYKPNQTIGFLGGREVRLVPRESKSKNDRKNAKPFEVKYISFVNISKIFGLF